jgi:5-methylcytosine-specific restriction endonuclease McrA
MTYKEQLKNANWQRKKFTIMHRDDFLCRICRSNYSLSVHHLHYIPNRKPWEYDDESLVVLCESCHNKIHYDLSKLSGIIAFNILAGKIDLSDVNIAL